MINELDIVALTHDVVDYRLKAGDEGTVVHCYDDGAGFEVEFVTADGKTVALLTLTATDIRPINRAEILHVREVEPVFA
ncbi:MAG: DUF4926 domain-containing protein [bacterium]